MKFVPEFLRYIISDFFVVFYNPPDTVQEFGVKVVEAQDPPKDKQ